jgi:hypothetical protein
MEREPTEGHERQHHIDDPEGIEQLPQADWGEDEHYDVPNREDEEADIEGS